MTILDDRPVQRPFQNPVQNPAQRPARVPSARPPGSRPRVAPPVYRGTGVRVSRAAHDRREVSAAATAALAAMAALITLWLGSLANVSGERAAAPGPVPDRLAVVRVQAGETLQHVAGRVAPDAPAGAIVDRILDLNQLDSAAVEAGQTLIAPVG